MNTRFAPEEIANKILQIAISNANKPDAKDSYKILRELKITNEMTGFIDFVDGINLSFSGIEEQFHTPIALALNTPYGCRLIRSATIDNTVTRDAVTYNLNKKLFEDKLLPNIEAIFKPAPEKKSSSISDYFTTLFARKSPSSKTEVTGSILLSKASTI